jgi:hypothetical protein
LVRKGGFALRDVATASPSSWSATHAKSFNINGLPTLPISFEFPHSSPPLLRFRRTSLKESQHFSQHRYGQRASTGAGMFTPHCTARRCSSPTAVPLTVGASISPAITRARLSFTNTFQSLIEDPIRKIHPRTPHCLEDSPRGRQAAMHLTEKYQPESATDRNVEGAGTPPASEVINHRLGAPVLVAPAENRRFTRAKVPAHDFRRNAGSARDVEPVDRGECLGCRIAWATALDLLGDWLWDDKLWRQ